MKHIIFCLTVLMAVACEKVVDFPSDEDGRIHISAMLGKEEWNRINIVVSDPVLKVEDTSSEDVVLHLEADGNPVSLLRDMDYESETDGEISYYVKEGFRPGQKLELKAEAPGLPSVSAVTYVPASLPEVVVTHQLVKSYKDNEPGQIMQSLRTLQNFHVVLDEQPEEESYFGVQVKKRKTWDIVGNPPLHVAMKYDPTLVQEEYDDLYVNTQAREGGAISSMEKELVTDCIGGEMAVSPAVLKDGKAVLDVFVAPTERHMVEAEYYGGEIVYEIYELYEFDIKVFRLSPELYHYFRARFIVEESDAPIHLGFSPVTYTYTNVNGGLGVFGAVAMYEIEWIRID